MTFKDVQAGYYWIVVDENYATADAGKRTALMAASLSWQITYTTDQYPCPYDSNYPDVTGLFQGCIVPVPTNGLPCVSYDSTNLVCLQCLTGYTLTAGACL